MELDLLQKTELFITNIEMENVNLGSVAQAVAKVLGLEYHEVAVVDVRDGILTLDILKSHVELEQIIGKEKDILGVLQKLPGVRITENTLIHSEGVLGMVCLDNVDTKELVERMQEIGTNIGMAVNKRVRVFPTGSEIIKNYIEDTNTPFLIEQFNQVGYKAISGPILDDNLKVVIIALREAVDEGVGIVVTTGGVGAEDKDHMVEAIQALDPEAVTPYLVHYHQGQGRHQKDGVRIAVGQMDWTTFVALPGPHDEVQLATPVLIKGLVEKWDKQTLAGAIAEVLRKKWANVGYDKKWQHHHEN